MKTYNLFVKQDEISAQLAQQIKAKLAPYFKIDQNEPDLVISIGGDGTMLKAIHSYFTEAVYPKFLGIHTGTLGFLTDFQRDEIDQLIELLTHEEYETQACAILNVEVISDHGAEKYLAINEVRIENNHETAVFDVFINHHHLETFRGNGLCMSTPLGSTAYNKSLGGAVIDVSLDLIQITEIAGIHNNAYRSLSSPLILGKGYEIVVSPNAYNEHLILGIDQMVIAGQAVKEIKITLAERRLEFAHYRFIPFVSRLKRAFIKDDSKLS